MTPRKKRSYTLSPRDRQVVDLWNSGRSLAEIGQLMGCKDSRISYIVNTVRKHHPELVTRGKGEHGSGPFSKRSAPTERLQQAINMWNDGVRLSEIARVIGYGGARSTSAIINQARHRWPEIYIRPPDYQGGSLRDTVADDTLIASWNLGRTTQEIAQELKISVQAVYNRVSRLISEGRVQRRTRDGLRGVGPRHQKFVEMWNSEASAVEIARALGCHVQSVYQVAYDLRKRGVSVVPRQGRTYVRRPETAQRAKLEQAQIVRLWDSGVSIERIARELGISRQLVSCRVYKLRKARPELNIKRRHR